MRKINTFSIIGQNFVPLAAQPPHKDRPTIRRHRGRPRRHRHWSCLHILLCPHCFLFQSNSPMCADNGEISKLCEQLRKLAAFVCCQSCVCFLCSMLPFFVCIVGLFSRTRYLICIKYMFHYFNASLAFACMSCDSILSIFSFLQLPPFLRSITRMGRHIAHYNE